MAWEIFTRQVIRTGTPTVTITTMGRISLNKTATITLEKNAVEFVLLMWDKDNHQIGIRPISKKDPRAYRLSYGAKGNGASFSAVTFLNYTNYDWSKTRSFPVEWNQQEDYFQFKVPAEHFTGKPQGVQLQLGKLKRRDRLPRGTTTKEVTAITQ